MNLHLRVYTASKLTHAPLWKTLRTDWPEIEFTANWIDMVDRIPDTPQFAERFWPRDLADIGRSDLVLCYAPSGEILRGALVECGAALAWGKRVLLVGHSDSFGSWQWHPLCSHARDLDHARVLLSEWAAPQRDEWGV